MVDTAATVPLATSPTAQIRVLITSFRVVYCPSLHSGQLGGQKSLSPLEKPLEFADYVFCPHKKITSRTIRISGTLIVNSSCR
jgi:hypothetical protein